MFMLSNVREQWFSNIRGDVLAGLVVGLALILKLSHFQLLQV
jgi:SulP family sulfate permease